MSSRVAYAIRRKNPESKPHWVYISDTPDRALAMLGADSEMVMIQDPKPIEKLWLEAERKISVIRSIVEDWGEGLFLDSEGKARNISTLEAQLREIKKAIGARNPPEENHG